MPPGSHPSDKLPTFLIAGVVKGGTTSLHNYLGQHPEVFMSAVKEPMYFAQYDVNPDNPIAEMTARTYARSEAAYRALFSGVRREKAVGESTPYYAYDPGAPERIAALLPNVKIVLLLRDPIERAYSHYLMAVREGQQRLPFLEALRQDYARPRKGIMWSHLYVEAGQYAAQIERYVQRFGRDRVLLLFSEDLAAAPVATLRRIFEFIGVDAAWADRIDTSTVHNPHRAPRSALAKIVFGSPRLRGAGSRLLPSAVRTWLRERVLLTKTDKPELSREAIEYLRPFFVPEIPRIEALCGRRPPWKTLLGDPS